MFALECPVISIACRSCTLIQVQFRLLLLIRLLVPPSSNVVGVRSATFGALILSEPQGDPVAVSIASVDPAVSPSVIQHRLGTVGRFEPAM